MFALHTSNRAENILSHLAQVIESQPLRSPFDKELFLIQSQGMERWLSQQLASDFGVWGNYQFYFPGKFFSEIGAQFADTSASGNYQREQMVWIFESLLREIESDDSGHFHILVDYIGGENSAVRRFQLAQQLARIFDQYQIMRPDWLKAWSKGGLIGLGDSEQWQALLWQKIEQGYGHNHRGEIWQSAIAAIAQLSAEACAEKLPQRLSIFGLNTIPPLLLHLLKGLSQHIDIHLYLLVPSKSYWGEGGSRQSMIEQLAQLDEVDETNETSEINDHRLLLSLGEQARDFRGLMLNQVEFSHEFSSYAPNEGESLSILQRLQNSLLNNTADFESLDKDGSIAIHSCHSRLREVEVLHDQILELLNEDSALELRDIVVMAPDIQHYAPHLKTIFADVPHAIADRTLKEESEILDNMIQFLRLSGGRFGWQEVIDLLEKPAIFAAFGLVESELEIIRHWVREVNIRWGLSAEHRSEFELPEFEAFSWQAGLDRLMMGLIVGNHYVQDVQDIRYVAGAGKRRSGEGLIDDILPYSDIEGNSAQPLGALFRFISILSQAHSELSRPATLTGWGERLLRYSGLIFEPRIAQERGISHLNAMVEQLSGELSAIHQNDVDIEVIEQWMSNYLSERKSSNGFLRGELTFCSMLPMRAIPFKVIALLGMNEGDYPRVVQPYTFDLMAADHRPGDRSPRNDDRAQFLDTLLSARERLIITYVGQSIQDNSEISPSAVVSELIDILDLNYRQQNVVIQHPLQPFNQKYFNNASPLFSYSQNHAKIATLLADQNRATKESNPWWQGGIEREPAQTIELNALFKFFKNPQSHFLAESLGIRLHESEQEPAERERFELDSLDNYLINQRIVEQMMAEPNASIDSFAIQTTQTGWWIGAAGEMELERRVELITPFVEEIRELNIGDKVPKVDIDITVGKYRLVGQLDDNYQNGALLHRYSRFKASDLIKGWLYHQIANRAATTTTIIMSQDRMLQLQPGMINPADLERWLDIYHAGQLEPSPLFVEPVLAYLTQAVNARARKSPLDAAKTALAKQFDGGYNPELNLLYRGVPDTENLIANLISDPFEKLCTDLLLPLWSELS